MKNILIGITSSIAAYKIYELIRLYKKNGYCVKTILTSNAQNFVSPLLLETLSNDKCYIEQFNIRCDVEHIKLVEWADVFVIAPISANTISKCANGVCDNLLTSIFCAFIGSKKPILLAPAMNCDMWNNPIVQNNIETLKVHCDIAYPQSGFLACGTEGIGRLSDINLIYHQSLRLIYQNKANNSKKIIVTLGGTREYIDSVRYITNASSGKMGIALCDWAYYLGFNVHAISSVEFTRPYKISMIDSALDMFNILLDEEFDYLIMAAAVADFRTENIKYQKISKENIKDTLDLKLIKNPDIVYEIAKTKKENQIIVGFCLSDNDLINCAKSKLKNKHLDFIVANDVKTALNTDKNKVTIIDKNDTMIDIDLDTKENIARKILEVICD